MEKWGNFLNELNEKSAKKARAHFAKEVAVDAEKFKEEVGPSGGGSSKPLRSILKKPKSENSISQVVKVPSVKKAQRTKIERLPKANKPIKVRKSLQFERKLLRATNVQDKVERAIKAKRAKRKAVRRDFRNAINRRITNPVNDDAEARYMEIATKGVVKFLQSVAALQN